MAGAARTVITSGRVAALGFIAWWKGGLMLQYHKEQEAVAWVVPTAVIWRLIRLGEGLPARVARVSPRQLAARLAWGVAVFFLVMAVVDPVLCVGVQGLPWSKGLFVEVGFFVPAGIALCALARRLAADARGATGKALRILNAGYSSLKFNLLRTSNRATEARFTSQRARNMNLLFNAHAWLENLRESPKKKGTSR